MSIFLKKNVKLLAIFWQSNGNFPEGHDVIQQEVSVLVIYKKCADFPSDKVNMSENTSDVIPPFLASNVSEWSSYFENTKYSNRFIHWRKRNLRLLSNHKVDLVAFSKYLWKKRKLSNVSSKVIIIIELYISITIAVIVTNVPDIK